MTSNVEENIISKRKTEVTTSENSRKLSNFEIKSVKKNLDAIENNDNLIRNKKKENMSYMNFIIKNGKEALCFFALILTTCATFQNNPQKISRAPTPRPFFSRPSLVHDSQSGSLNQTHHDVSISELAFVFYYAPWCAESQHAREPYNDVAKIFNSEAHFGAVNCWQPGSECRLHYTKVQKWPVLMAYFPNELSVQYHGSWTYSGLIKFVTALLKPMKRFFTAEDLLKASVGCDAVVLGFFELNTNFLEYYIFYQTAIKWLERDPYQEITFGIVTGESAKLFGVDSVPSIRMYLWNETLQYNNVTNWNQNDINKWIVKHIQQVSLWLAPPGTKSSSLAPYLNQGPVLLLFTPRNVFASLIDGYGLIRQIGLEYYNCANDFWITEMARDYIPHQRSVNYNDFIRLKTQCNILHEKEYKNNFEKYEKCYENSISVTFGNVMNSSKSFILNNIDKSYYDISNKLNKKLNFSDNYNANQYCTTKQNSNEKNYKPQYKKASLACRNDYRTIDCLKQIKLKEKCDFLRLSEKDNIPLFFTSSNNEKDDLESISGLACQMNNTFSLIAIDSLLYHTFAERLGIDILTIENKSAAIIIDSENESTYLLDEPITTKSLTRFLNRFTKQTLARYLRSDSVQYKHTHFYNFEHPLKPQEEDVGKKFKVGRRTSKTISIMEIYSENFEEIVIKSNKTVLTLFYSSQCAFCGMMSQNLLIISNILRNIENIDFVRIDGDKNDLAWFYTMNVFPTLIIFPENDRKSESRIYPNELKVNLKNILGFILANLNRPTRLYAITLACKSSKKTKFLDDCVATLRREVSDHISFSLREWRRVSYMRRHILKRLSILQNIYLNLININHIKDVKSIEKNAKYLVKIWTSNYNNN